MGTDLDAERTFYVSLRVLVVQCKRAASGDKLLKAALVGTHVVECYSKSGNMLFAPVLETDSMAICVSTA